MMTNKGAHFSPELFEFLRELKTNNNRDWFAANKERYERVVKQPMLAFIADLAPHLEKISRFLVVDPRPQGGSMFRIYRDVRFSEDKSPYKTAASAHFPHGKASGNVHVPGYYLHLEPGQCFAGGGIWHPDTRTLTSIRKTIVSRSSDWKKLRKTTQLDGAKLSRPPKGFAAEHPLVEDLKFKDYVTGVEYKEEQICNANFLALYIKDCKQIAPFIRFLSQALRLPW